MKKKLIIFGSSGSGLDILSIVEQINKEKERIEFLGFLDDNLSKAPKRIQDQIIGKFQKIKRYNKYNDIYFITGFGNENNFKNKPKIIKSLGIQKQRFMNIFHPTCIIDKEVKIGFGNVFHAYVTISRDVTIKNHVLILPKSTINHDTTLDSYSIINTNVSIAGNVTIKENCYIGTGTNIRDHIMISKQNLIGMGSNVTKNLDKNNSVYFGNPAKFIR